MKRIPFASAACLLLAAAVTGCSTTATEPSNSQTTPAPSASGGSGSPEGALVKVRVSEVIRSIFYAPEYVALSQGFFKQQGLDVDLTTAWAGDKAMTALLSNNADIAMIGAETTIFVKQQGNPDTVVNFAQLTQRDGSFLVGRKQDSNFDWASLKGHSLLGSRNGSMPEMVSEYILRKHGIKPKVDNQIIQNVNFDNMTVAFSAGVGDFYQAFEPSASELESKGQGYVVASYGEESGRLPYTGFMAKDSYIKAHPDTIQKFTNAITEGEIWVHQHTSDDIVNAIAPYFPGVDHSLMKSVVERYQKIDTWPTNGKIDQDEFNHLQDIIKEAGELKGPADYNQLVNTTFADKAAQTYKP